MINKKTILLFSMCAFLVSCNRGLPLLRIGESRTYQKGNYIEEVSFTNAEVGSINVSFTFQFSVSFSSVIRPRLQEKEEGTYIDIIFPSKLVVNGNVSSDKEIIFFSDLYSDKLNSVTVSFPRDSAALVHERNMYFLFASTNIADDLVKANIAEYFIIAE